MNGTPHTYIYSYLNIKNQDSIKKENGSCIENAINDIKKEDHTFPNHIPTTTNRNRNIFGKNKITHTPNKINNTRSRIKEKKIVLLILFFRVYIPIQKRIKINCNHEYLFCTLICWQNFFHSTN